MRRRWRRKWEELEVTDLGEEVHCQPLGEVHGGEVRVLQHLPGARPLLGVLGEALPGEGVETGGPPRLVLGWVEMD